MRNTTEVIIEHYANKIQKILSDDADIDYAEKESKNIHEKVMFHAFE